LCCHSLRRCEVPLDKPFGMPFGVAWYDDANSLKLWTPEDFLEKIGHPCCGVLSDSLLFLTQHQEKALQGTVLDIFIILPAANPSK
jgi:hypothetical protein